jgi:hypothetical protein
MRGLTISTLKVKNGQGLEEFASKARNDILSPE